jgi:hypothetical protein
MGVGFRRQRPYVRNAIGWIALVLGRRPDRRRFVVDGAYIPDAGIGRVVEDFMWGLSLLWDSVGRHTVVLG